MKYFLIILVMLSFSCSEKKKAEIRKIEGIECNVKDTISEIVIIHQECTECLDAFKKSGTLYIPENVMRKIENFYKNREGDYISIPSGYDLYLTGENKIADKLFGNNVYPIMGNKFIVKGKVIGFKKLGIIFRVDSYKKIE
jgi:hypothetical protein